ncbi:MAG: TatD family hydrolase [Caldisphaera sp.]|jgi:TatD-related deoxyribonuclease|nr:TatD family hydrolase [Caldisphaera sp.]PMP59480.1 MAG: hypothetical protein C0202_02400 [Caldisphaera sp.]
MIFADAHSHINPVKGLGYKIAEKFKEKNGWFISFISASPWDYFDDFQGFKSYQKMIEYQINECKKANNLGIKSVCIAGFHPEDIDFIIDKYHASPSYVLDLGLKVVEYEGNLCKEGQLFGLGEVGRQHYKSMPERIAVSQIILEKALEIAKDNDCMVHLHLENSNIDTVKIIDYSVNKINIKDKRKIVFHHAKPSMIIDAYNLGYSATLYGIDPVLSKAFSSLPPIFMIESDFPDMPNIKKTVAPWELPQKILDIYNRLSIDEKYLYKINVENVENAYKIKP